MFLELFLLLELYDNCAHLEETPLEGIISYKSIKNTKKNQLILIALQ